MRHLICAQLSRAAAVEELIGDREIEVHRRVAGLERGCRHAANIHFLRFIEREVSGQEAREQRHVALDFGADGFIVETDHRADRAAVVVHAFEGLGIYLLTGQMRDRDGKTGDDAGREYAREDGEFRADTCPADVE